MKSMRIPQLMDMCMFGCWLFRFGCFLLIIFSLFYYGCVFCVLSGRAIRNRAGTLLCLKIKMGKKAQAGEEKKISTDKK